MSRLEELIQQLCPDGVEYKAIKEEYQRLKGTPITAAKMKEIAHDGGNIRVFAGGKTVIDTYEEDIPNANIIRVPAVLVQSRGVIDAIYYENKGYGTIIWTNNKYGYCISGIANQEFLIEIAQSVKEENIPSQ